MSGQLAGILADPFHEGPIPLVPLGERRWQAADLPVPLTTFVGRERDVEAVVALVRNPEVRLLTLTGPGGVGKTRLALRVAMEVATDFPDGAVFVPLEPVTDHALVISTIAQALDVTEAADVTLLRRLIAVLQRRRFLLLLDNLEQVLDAAPDLAALLAACQGLTMLVTSRELLRVSGEQAYSVLPLSIPDPADVTPEQIGEAEAVRLLVARARAVRPDFVLTPDNAATVAAIVRRVDGLPLAVELAAARTNALPPSALLERLDRRLPLLTGGARDQPARLRTMRDAIAWSYDLLTTEEQTLFCRLAVFVGGFTSAECRVLSAEYDENAVLDLLGSLVDKSLVHLSPLSTQHSALGTRYGMLETVREFAVEQLAATGEEVGTRHRHAEWCLALAESAEPHLDDRDQARWMERLDAELGNVRAALAWLLEIGEAAKVLRLVTALYGFWLSRPYHAEVQRWLTVALDRNPNASASLRFAAVYTLVVFAGLQGDHERAVARAEDLLAFARTADDPYILGRAYEALAVAWEWRGDGYKAAAAYEQSVPLLRQAGPDEWIWVALTVSCLGDTLHWTGNVGRAESLIEEGLALYREHEHLWGIALTLGIRAYLALKMQDYPLAVRLFQESIAVAREVGDGRAVMGAVAGLAGVSRALGQRERAARLLGAVAAAQETTGLSTIMHSLHAKRVLDATRAELGEPAFAAAWESGRALRFADAIDDALAVSAVPDTAALTAEPSADPFGLTARELDVLRLLASGRTDAEIAAALFISPRTASNHVGRIFAKLDVSSRAAAAARAVQRGLI